MEKTSTLAVRADALDMAEKLIFAGIFVFFAWRMVDAYRQTGGITTLLYLFDQIAVLIFILVRRRPKTLSLRLDDWIAGFLGTLLAIMIVAPSGNALAPNAVVWSFLMVGFAVHVSAKLTLRRSFGVVAANRGVKVSGPYRLVRHPMYLGYVLSQIGVILAGPNIPNITIILICWGLYVWRIIAEERLLTEDAKYRALCLTTRWRLIPGIY